MYRILGTTGKTYIQNATTGSSQLVSDFGGTLKEGFDQKVYSIAFVDDQSLDPRLPVSQVDVYHDGQKILEQSYPNEWIMSTALDGESMLGCFVNQSTSWNVVRDVETGMSIRNLYGTSCQTMLSINNQSYYFDMYNFSNLNLFRVLDNQPITTEFTFDGPPAIY